MMIKDPDKRLQSVIESAVNVLREPAGKKYKTIEDIRCDNDQFLKDFHTGLYLLHVLTIRAIIDAEDNLLETGRDTKAARSSHKGWTRLRQLFRCINDAIVWIALRDEPALFIRRTCRKQPRGNLRDQNHDSIMKAMQHLFAGGEFLPIWNDATRCIDISDITLFSPRGISFLELKTGNVNEQILDMMGKTNSVEILSEFGAFFEKYGQKGIRQIERVIRQGDRSSKLIELSKHDNVFDPFLEVERCAITPDQPLERYDTELPPLFQDLRSRDFVALSIDNCLHVLALNRLRGVSIEKGRELVRQHLQDKICRPTSEEIDCREVILNLESSFDYPTAMPIMLRPWSSEDIAGICLGHTEVYFTFDVNAWGKHLRSARLAWSSKREGKKELNKPRDDRLFIVQDRIPQIVNQKGDRLSIGTQFLQIMICEGIRPASLAAYYERVFDR
ncbi:MAG: hypothetical protein A2156_00295 [Deltaproteobacteria bacterium RBG_16_48_10]|nr:MAG: hypothetical protein A2156_00295 [Deltaproteobacteria bacterium RBG_16_48_10]